MKSARLLLWIAIFLVVGGVSRVQADSGRGRHQKLYAVPAPRKVVIDGKLDDWDLSGQIWMYVISETADMQGAKFAMMYDREAVYISGVVRDTSPMMNRHDPRVDPERAWDADVCQIFLNLDPGMGYPVAISKEVIDRMATMYLWYYSDLEEPCLALFGGMSFTEPYHPAQNAKGVVPHDKFQAAYLKAADGRGYTFEYRIPYTTLGLKQPLKANDLLAATACFFWGTADGLKTAGGAAWAYDVMSRPGIPVAGRGVLGKVIFADKGHIKKDLVEEGLPPEKPLPLTFEYDLPEECQATIQLFDDKGTVVRTLVAQSERRAGRNVERWDGLDVFGKPLTPGNYLWKGLYHHGITTKFLFSAHNSGQPPYHTDDNTGSWGGDHGTPTAVCTAGDAVVMTWSMSEAGSGTINTDLNGKRRWGNLHNACDVATDGPRLFVAGDAGYEGANSVKIFESKDGRPLNWGNGHLTLTPPPATARGAGAAADAASQATAVAYGSGRVYVSWAAQNLVGVYDATSGDLQTTWSVPAPGRLVARPDGAVLVISEGKILAFQNGKPAVFVADHLAEPRGLALGTDGALYVANAGPLQNVSVFDAAGKYARSIGKPGGRPAVGRYDPSGILEPGGLALDKNGHLWVAETTDFPKRVSEWDAKTGALVNEFFGGSGYFGWAYLDPRHPDEIYCHNVLWKVDWKNNTVAPYSTIWRPTAPNMIGEVNPNGYNGALRVVSQGDGRQFSYGNAYGFQMIYSRRDGDIFKPVTASIRICRSGVYCIGPQYDILKDEKKYPDGVWYWVDKNNDQTVQADELSSSDAAYNQVVADLWHGVTDPGELEAQKIGLQGSDLVHMQDGKVLWAYRGGVEWHQAINLPPIKPGNMNGLTMPLGVAGQFTGAASYFGVFNIVTTDGVYVAQGFRDGRLGGRGPDVLCSETVTGQLVKPDGMNRYFFLGGAADGRVTEILGLDQVKRLPGGEFVYTPAYAKTAAEALRDYQAILAKSQGLTIVRGRASLANTKAVGKILDEQRSFTARAAYDEQNLYVEFNVNSPNDLLNAATDPRLLFKGGNVLDIQLATDSSAGASRKTPAPGDIRLLVTRQNGPSTGSGTAVKPFAMLYRPKVKGFKGDPIVLKSPTGQEPFDAIEPVEVALDYAKTPTGFHAFVTVPLARIGWKPQPGQTVKIDLGYIYGNATGTQTAVRSYWRNAGFSAGVVADVPNESRLEPHEWGTAAVE